MTAPELVYRGPWRAGGVVLFVMSVSLVAGYGEWGSEVRIS